MCLNNACLMNINVLLFQVLTNLDFSQSSPGATLEAYQDYLAKNTTQRLYLMCSIDILKNQSKPKQSKQTWKQTNKHANKNFGLIILKFLFFQHSRLQQNLCEVLENPTAKTCASTCCSPTLISAALLACPSRGLTILVLLAACAKAGLCEF